jgi:hypothetical protein
VEAINSLAAKRWPPQIFRVKASFTIDLGENADSAAKGIGTRWIGASGGEESGAALCRIHAYYRWRKNQGSIIGYGCLGEKHAGKGIQSLIVLPSISTNHFSKSQKN